MHPEQQSQFPCIFTFDELRGLLRMVYSGCLTLEDKLNAIDELCDQVRLHRCPNIIIDRRKAEIRMTLDEQQRYGRYIASLPALRHVKAAVLHPGDLDASCIMDAVAFNNGFCIAQFSDENEAVSWLKN